MKYVILGVPAGSNSAQGRMFSEGKYARNNGLVLLIIVQPCGSKVLIAQSNSVPLTNHCSRF